MRKYAKIALVLSIIMMVSFVTAGCGTTKDTSNPTSKSGDATGTEKKQMDISVAFWDLAEFGNDDIGKKVQDDLKIKLTVMPMDWGNAEEQAQLWSASNSLPDMLSTYTVEQDISRFYQWIDNKITRSIPDELINKYPNVKALFDNNDIVKAVKQIKGTYTFIPRPASLKAYYKFDQGCGMYYRKDWLKNVGITKAPETVDEFYTMLERFTNGDPDGNKVNDTYGMTCGGSVPLATFNWWGANPESWQFEDGKWIPGYASKNIVEGLKFWRRAYTEKLLDPEFASNNLNQNIQKFSQGTFGVSYRNVDVKWFNKVAVENFAVTQKITGADKAVEAVGVVPPIKSTSGITGWPAVMETSGTEISAKVDDEKLDRILELVEYLMKPEISTMFRYGFEGKEYVKNGDQIVPLVNQNTGLPVNIGAIYPSGLLYGFATWDLDGDIEGPGIAKPVQDAAAAVRDQFNPIAVKDNFAIRFMSTPAKDATYVDVAEGFSQIVMSTEPVETAYKNWLNEQYGKGIDTAIAEVNKKATELGIK